jgi:hypothetical protein
MCINEYHLIKSCEFFAPNDAVREDIAQMRREHIEAFGEPSAASRIMSDYVFLKASLAKITSITGRRAPGEEPFRKYTSSRRYGSPLEMPYDVEYPREHEQYEFERHRVDKEMKLVDKVVELIESDDQSAESAALLNEIRTVLDNVESIGHLAKLVDKLGDSIDLSKGWLRSEVLKSLGN